MTSSALSTACVPQHIGLVLDRPARSRDDWVPAQAAASTAVSTLIDGAVSAGVRFVTVWPADDWDAEAPLTALYAEIAREVPHVHTRWVPGSYTPVAPPAPRPGEAVVSFVGPHDGRRDVAEAVRGWLEDHLDRSEDLGRLAEKVDLGALRSFSRGGGLPLVDLVIRSAGSWPVCSSLLVLTAYAEFHPLACHWDQLDADGTDGALIAFSRRHRRYGR